MNKARRAALNDLRNQIDEVKDTVEQMVETLGGLRDEEQEGFDNMSEGLQQSETGQRIEAAADALDNAHTELEAIGEEFQSVMDQIDEAAGA